MQMRPRPEICRPPKRPRTAAATAAAAAAKPEGVRCIDLFCGMGGVSEGFRQAGHRVVLAIDSNQTALRWHAANHPNCKHYWLKLGAASEDALLELIRQVIPPGTRFHLHGSPPCTHFSVVRNIRKGTRRPDLGMELVVWFTKFVNRLRPTTWSMENVVHKTLSEYLTKHRIAFGSFNFAHYGVPQTRRRCLVGTRRLIDRLKTDATLRVTHPVTVRAALRRTIPRAAVFIRGSAGRASIDHFRTLDRPAWCVLASSKPTFVAADGRCIRTLTLSELMRLQTFSASYKPPRVYYTQRDAVRCVGNAVPPLVARLFLDPLA